MMLTGGCFCGAVRYRSAGAVIDAGLCHCTLCQKTSGAPTVGWVSVPRAGFRFTQGNPTEFASSPQGRRTFCPHCGTHLTFTRTDGDEVDLTVSSLDDERAIPLDYHIWTVHQHPWLQLTDTAPKHADGGPDR